MRTVTRSQDVSRTVHLKSILVFIMSTCDIFSFILVLNQCLRQILTFLKFGKKAVQCWDSNPGLLGWKANMLTTEPKCDETLASAQYFT